jgi:hypothetical protein
LLIFFWIANKEPVGPPKRRGVAFWDKNQFPNGVIPGAPLCGSESMVRYGAVVQNGGQKWVVSIIHAAMRCTLTNTECRHTDWHIGEM